MHADKRRAGRAIRKQRRLAREGLRRVLAIDVTPIIDAFAELGRALSTVGEVAAEMSRVVFDAVPRLVNHWRNARAEWHWVYAWRMERWCFDERLAFRALTTGPA